MDIDGLLRDLLVFYGIHVTGRNAICNDTPSYRTLGGVTGYSLLISVRSCLYIVVSQDIQDKAWDIVHDMIFTQVASAGLPNSTWKMLLSFDSAIYTEISMLRFEIQEFDVFTFMTKFLGVDLSELEDTLRGFYLLTLRQMLQRIPLLTDKLQPLFAQLIEAYQCQDIFEAVPLDVTQALHPITGGIGLRGGKSALNNMIGEYAARSPTRAEVVNRLIERPCRASERT